MTKTIISHQVEASKKLGEKIGAQLKGGEVIALTGDLGSGKTTFIQGLAKGLGVSAKVNSPTFNILKLYPVKKSKTINLFCHLDTYRLNSESELASLGLSDFLDRADLVIAIEWAEKAKNFLAKVPKDRLIKIEFKHQTEKTRIIKIKSNK